MAQIMVSLFVTWLGVFFSKQVIAIDPTKVQLFPMAHYLKTLEISQFRYSDTY